MRLWIITGLAIALCAASAAADEFEKPVRLKAAGKLIDTEVGHAAPYIVDWDGDGKRDLLVGQFGSGKLRVYRNEGTNAAPKYAAGKLFQAGGKLGTVPTG